MNAPKENGRGATQPPQNNAHANFTAIDGGRVKAAHSSAAELKALRDAELAPAEHLRLICQPGKYATQSHAELKDIRKLFTTLISPSAKPKADADAVLQACPDPGMQLPIRKKGWRPTHMAVMMLDIDSGNLPLERVGQLASEFFGAETIAAVYSSSSASENDRHWRIAVPLKRPTETPIWLQAMKAFAAFALERGITIDKALFTRTQPVFLPNVPHELLNKDGSVKAHGRHQDGTPIFYQQLNLGHRLVDLTAITAPAGARAMQDQARRDTEAAEAAAQCKAQAEARFSEREAERARLLAEGKESRTPIELFKELHDTNDLLAKYGFIEDTFKPGHWHHPELQTTGSYATMVSEAGHWVTKSSTLREAGLGVASASGETNHGDQFDLIQFFEFKNDRSAAVKGVAQALGLKTVQPGSLPDIDAFTAIARPEGNIIPFPGAPGVVTVEPAPARRRGLVAITREQSYAKPPASFMLDNVLPYKGVVNLYGPSGAGKTFLVLDLIYHLMSGSTEWFGNKIYDRPKGILYIVLEDVNGVTNRGKAWEQHHEVEPENIYFVENQTVNLSNTESVDDIIECALATVGKGCMVILDTQAQAVVGTDEQSAKDMGLVYSNLHKISRAIDGLCVTIAHSGKDDSKGVRGSSAQYAACDVVIGVKEHGGARVWAVEKSKLDVGGHPGHFTLERTVIGKHPRTGADLPSGYVMPRGAPSAAKIPLSPAAKTVLEALERLIEDSDGKPVTKEAVRVASYDAFKASDREVKQDTLKKNFGNGFKALLAANRIFPSGAGYVVGFGIADAPDHVQRFTGVSKEDTS